MTENKIREGIIEALRKNPQGLTILDISKILEMNRNTVTKYIYELSGAGVIEHRKIGTAKLCFLNKKEEKKWESTI
jgi:predicted transcriptional regulator